MKASEEFATDEEAAELARRRKRKAEEDEQWAKLLRAQLGTAQGREFVSIVLESFCGVGARSFSFESNEATSYNEGKRSVGISLLAQVQQLAPELYVEMMKEQLVTFQKLTQEEKLSALRGE